MRSIEQRYWTHRFRVAGRQTELSLGPYPAVTFDEALKKYHEQRAQATSGVDPIADKHERRRKGSGTVCVGALAFAEDSLQTSVLNAVRTNLVGPRRSGLKWWPGRRIRQRPFSLSQLARVASSVAHPNRATDIVSLFPL